MRTSICYGVDCAATTRRWEGDYTLDYNYQANIWGTYSSNRIYLADSFYQPLLDYVPMARRAAAAKNCSGLSFIGHIGPFGTAGTLAGISNGQFRGDMGIQSNGVFVSINFVLHWEMTRDIAFLRSIAFPFVRDVFGLYKCLLHRRLDGSYIDLSDSDNECDPPGTFVGGFDPRCTKPNVADANAFIRRIAAALPSMADALNEPIDSAWADVAQHLVPLAVHGGVFTLCDVTNSTDRDAAATPNASFRGPFAPDCNGTASGWFGWPGEAVTLNDTREVLETAQRTLAAAALWSQGNSLCSIFASAARVGLSVDDIVPHFHRAIAPCVPNKTSGSPNAVGVTCTLPNGVVFQEGGGLEIVGGAEFVNSLLVQSIVAHDGSGESYITLLPWVSRQGGVGGFQHNVI